MAKQLQPTHRWRGDEHFAQLTAAQEVGLSAEETALDLYHHGFKESVTLCDPNDDAIVLRGRTVLTAAQLIHELTPTLTFHRISPRSVRVLCHDGQFEMRIRYRLVHTPAVLRSLCQGMLGLWSLLGLTLWIFPTLWPPLMIIGVLISFGLFRRSLQPGRKQLAQTMLINLARLAHHRQLILPPAEAERNA